MIKRMLAEMDVACTLLCDPSDVFDTPADGELHRHRVTGPEIADRTGLTHGSVRVNLHRGMELLRASLGITPPARPARPRAGTHSRPDDGSDE